MLIQDTIQTPNSIVLCYGAMLATSKKIIMEKSKDKTLVDYALLK